MFYLGVPGRPQLTFLGYPASKRRANTVLLNIFVNNHGNILINGESFSLLLFIMLCFGAYLLLLSSVAVKLDVLCFIYAPSMPSMKSLLFSEAFVTASQNVSESCVEVYPTLFIL